jgi:hypothetical protein
MAEAPRDQNRVTALLGTSVTDGVTPIAIYADDTTHELFVKSASGSAINTDSKWNTNHLDDYTTTSVTYIGQETTAGVWKMVKIDETGNFPVFTYASVSNNATLTTYALAWAGRVTAVYDVYSSAF